MYSFNVISIKIISILTNRMALSGVQWYDWQQVCSFLLPSRFSYGQNSAHSVHSHASIRADHTPQCWYLLFSPSPGLCSLWSSTIRFGSTTTDLFNVDCHSHATSSWPKVAASSAFSLAMEPLARPVWLWAIRPMATQPSTCPPLSILILVSFLPNFPCLLGSSFCSGLVGYALLFLGSW